jgi:DNA-binding ferritin-like protein (Dps family)
MSEDIAHCKDKTFETNLDLSLKRIGNYCLEVNALTKELKLDPMNMINMVTSELIHRDNKNLNTKLVARFLADEYQKALKSLEESIWTYIVCDKGSEYTEVNKILDLIDKTSAGIVKKIIKESIEIYSKNNDFYPTWKIEFYIQDLKEIIKDKGKEYLQEMGKSKEPGWYRNIGNVKRQKVETLEAFLLEEVGDDVDEKN